MQVARRAGAGGQGPAVSELGPEAAGELTALSGAAYRLTAAVGGGGGTGEQVAAELADPDVLTIGVGEPARGQQLLAAASVRVDPHDRGWLTLPAWSSSRGAGSVGPRVCCCAPLNADCRATSGNCGCRSAPLMRTACGSTPGAATGRRTGTGPPMVSG